MGKDIVGIFLDGKTFAEDMMIIPLGTRMDGEKRPLRFVQAGIENERAVVQRCQWHKGENVVSHLAKHEQGAWRKRLQPA